MKTLLLDKIYQPLLFISYKKMAKLVMVGKANVISTWPGISFYGEQEYPAVIILKEYIRTKPIIPRFNFRRVLRRDKYTCMYTGEKLPVSQLTVDHILPKSRGGKSTWENCVAAGMKVNSAKGNMTPEEAGLKLLCKPQPPTNPVGLEYVVMKKVHPDWKDYFQGYERI